jgi:hypothetical protein
MSSTSPKYIMADEISSNIEMKKIFKLIKKFAKDPVNQLITRNLWSEYSLILIPNGDNSILHKKVQAELKNSNELLKKASLNRCGKTAESLKRAIFGVKNTHLNRVVLSNEFFCKEELDKKIWSTIRENENCFEDKPLSHFFGYFFGCATLDHAFFIVQHRDVQHNIKYRILQSWQNEHSLYDYMKNRGHYLSSEEFAQFANGLNHVLFHKEHTYQKDIFYEHYFMAQAIFNCDDFMTKATLDYYAQSGHGHIEVEWGSSNLDKINNQIDEFENFKMFHVSL